MIFGFSHQHQLEASGMTGLIKRAFLILRFFWRVHQKLCYYSLTVLSHVKRYDKIKTGVLWVGEILAMETENHYFAPMPIKRVTKYVLLYRNSSYSTT